MKAHMAAMLLQKGSIIVLALFVLPLPSYAANRETSANAIRQSITANGRLLCDGNPLQNVLIQIYEYDIDPNDFLNETRTDANGRFKITGGQNEIGGGIQPYMNISNVRCTINCDKRWNMRIWFGKVRSHVRREFGDIEMANVCANVDEGSEPTDSEFIAKLKEAEDYDEKNRQLMDFRYSWKARKAAKKPLVGVSGQVMCAGKPLQYLKVKLFDVSSGVFKSTKLLNRTHTDANGRFVVVGHDDGAYFISPVLNISNVNCNKKCTGRTEFKFVLKKVRGIFVLTLGTIDLANACQKPKMELEFRHQDYDVNGQLTCGKKPLSGVHLSLHDWNWFFTHRPHGLVKMNTTETGYFALRTTEFLVEEDLFLNISGVQCGTKCNGNWHMKVMVHGSFERFVKDLGITDMSHVCSTYESGQTINFIHFSRNGVYT